MKGWMVGVGGRGWCGGEGNGGDMWLMVRLLKSSKVSAGGRRAS